jgi:hypothetical protein
MNRSLPCRPQGLRVAKRSALKKCFLLVAENEQQLLDQDDYDDRSFSERSDRRKNWE